MTCPACNHPEHAPGPCAVCAQANENCWQSIRVTGGDGDRAAEGVIDMATGLEQKPCMLCRHWKHDGAEKMAEHFLAHGLEAQPNGMFKTPIAKDFPGRKSLVLDPRNFGFCQRDALPTDMQATCERWQPTKDLVDFKRRMRA